LFQPARDRIHRVVMLATGAYSVALGVIFLLGVDVLPPLS